MNSREFSLRRNYLLRNCSSPRWCTAFPRLVSDKVRAVLYNVRKYGFCLVIGYTNIVLDT